MKSLFRSMIVAGVFAAGVVPALADDAKPEDAVKYREAVMSVIGGHTGAFFAILQGKVPHKDALSYHANAIAAASEHVGPAFEQDTTGTKSEAKDAIWADKAKFDKHVQDFEQAAKTLASAVDSGDMAAIGPAAKNLGGACKACHDDFRQE
jgi:cytochrome c556